MTRGTFSLDELRCRGLEEKEIPVLGDLIDAAFARRGITGTGPSLAASIEHRSNIRVIYWQHDGTQQLLGTCPIREYPCHFGPSPLVSGALSLVAIDPAYQRRGIGQKMLHCAQEYMLQQGFDTCLLFTGSPSFYEHTGWVQAIYEHYCEIPASAIYARNDFSPRNLHSRDISATARAYEAFNKDRVLTKVRDDAWWHRRLSKEGFTSRFTCVSTDDELAGYGCIELVVPAGWKPPAGFDADGIAVRRNRLVREPRVEISEYAIVETIPENMHDHVMDALLAHARDMAMQCGCNLVGTSLPSSFPLSKRLRSAGAIIKDSWWSSLMILVVNVPAFLAKLKQYQEQVIIPKLAKNTLESIEDFDIGLSVEHLHEHHPFVVQYKKQGTSLSVTIDPRTAPRTLVPINVHQLTRIALGNYTPDVLVDSECWTCPEPVIEPLGLFFNTISNVVYQNDHF